MSRVINNKMDQKGNTNITVHKCNYLWTINNFTFGFQSKLIKGEALTSPTFTIGKNNKLLWNLKLNRKVIGSVAYLPLFIKLESNNKEDIKIVQAKYKFSIINDKDEVSITSESSQAYSFEQESERCEEFMTEIFVFEKENGILADDKLRILCEVSVLGGITCLSNTIQVPECRMSDDFGILFETKKFSDAILSVADGREVQVHKYILAARSPVFAAMFEHEMKELKDNHVKIIDVDYEILHELLQFIYTGKVENLEIMADELLAAADKYDLQRLKLLCEKELCENLSTENAAEILQLADLHGADQLKTQTIDFINANPDVMDTIGWKQLKEKFPRVIAEVYEALVTSKIPLIGL
ncbi:speckle-type POZ protein B-like [Chrysoperla carnea]|uniref:speckle-type POZ protein B-like n=1 Tax=Chrysoperla carnea TaxID=189513 RepID=UPI001D060A8F|nr:speckle-type POZ protein B-like [Chrysoperla carnea]